MLRRCDGVRLACATARPRKGNPRREGGGRLAGQDWRARAGGLLGA